MSILLKPSRGVLRHAGGAYDRDAQQDIIDTDAFQGPIQTLDGGGTNTDVIPGQGHVGGNFIIINGAIDAITLAVPLVGSDDGLTIAIVSDTAFAHTLTLPLAAFAIGTATPKTVATFAAQRGAGLLLRAWNGTWQVLGNIGPVAFA
jgi:hypothetical protein